MFMKGIYKCSFAIIIKKTVLLHSAEFIVIIKRIFKVNAADVHYELRILRWL